MNIKCHGNWSRRVPFNGRRSVKKPRLNSEHPTKRDAIGILVYPSFWNCLICNCLKFVNRSEQLPVFSSSAFFFICQCFLHLYSFSSASVFFIFILSQLPVFYSSSFFLFCQCFYSSSSSLICQCFLLLQTMSGSGKSLLGLWLYRSGEEWTVKQSAPKPSVSRQLQNCCLCLVYWGSKPRTLSFQRTAA